MDRSQQRVYSSSRDLHGEDGPYGMHPWNDSHYHSQPYMNGSRKPPRDNHPHPKEKESSQVSPSQATSEKSTKRPSKRKRVVNKFAENTSLQGIPFIYTATKNYAKAIWTFIFIAALAATGYQAYTVVAKFFSRATTSKVSVGYSTLPFPTVTLCNINPVRLDYVDDGGEEFADFINSMEPDKDFAKDPITQPPPDQRPRPEQGQEQGQGGKKARRRKRRQTADSPPPQFGFGLDKDILANKSFYDDYEDDYYDDDHQSDFGYGAKSQASLVDEVFTQLYTDIPFSTRKDMGHQKETMILFCSFNERDCGAYNFTDHQSSTYGNCMSFNANLNKPALKSKRSGALHGLTLWLYLETYQYISLTHGEGIRMDVHPHGTMPFINENGIALAPGLETLVGMKMINMTRMGPPYGTCGDGGTFNNEYGRTYTTDGCLNTCLDRNILARCNCFRKSAVEYYSAKAIKSSKPCESSKDYKCISKLEVDIAKGQTDCSCNAACNSVSYEMVLSSNLWPRDSLWFDLVDAVCDRDEFACYDLQQSHDPAQALRRNFMKVNIFYRDLNFEAITEQADYDGSQFLSDLGGTAGLYVGASALTAVEVMHLIILLICGSCCKSKKKDPQPDYEERRPHHRGDNHSDFNVAPRYNPGKWNR